MGRELAPTLSLFALRRRLGFAPPLGEFCCVLLGGENRDDTALFAGRRHVNEVVVAESLLDLRPGLEIGEQTDMHGVGHCFFPPL